MPTMIDGCIARILYAFPNEVNLKFQCYVSACRKNRLSWKTAYQLAQTIEMVFLCSILRRF